MSTNATETDLVGTAEVIAELDVDRATLIRWVRSDIAKPAMKMPGPNGAYLFARSEIDRLRELRGGRKQMPRMGGAANSESATPPVPAVPTP